MRLRRGPWLWLAVAFAVFAASLITGAAFLSAELGDAPVARRALVAFAGLCIVLAGTLMLAVWKIVGLTLIKPARTLAIDLVAASHGENRCVDTERYAPFTPLPDAINKLLRHLTAARHQVAEAVAAATANTQMEKARLAAILNDLHEGVVVCNRKDQVVLYNQIALGLLGVAGEMGLGRNLSRLLAMEPVLHIFDVLLHRPADSLANAPFITATADGRSLLHGRMSLVRAQGEVTGYVITFDDVTGSVSALGKRDALLREVIEALRDPVARLQGPAADGGAATAEIAAVLEWATTGYRSLLAGWWPMTDIHSAYLFDFVIRRLDDSGLKVNMTGLPIWLHGDGHSLVLALEALVRAIAKGTGAREFDLAAVAEGGRGWICVSWRGTRVDDASLIDWQKARISPALGHMTVRDVMVHHTRDDLVEEASDGVVTLRIALYLGREGQDRAAIKEKLPPRPEFFDFNLLAQGLPGDLGQVRLADLTYVVFDTETTGLQPTEGDRIVSIAGVRIVNGRILTGESFQRIVNPGRRIPAESVKFHGITDDMVGDKPPLSVVLPQFKAYVADAVMVAHNAAFDLKFLRLNERESGVSFGNPVLDTMLLSSYVDGTPEDQSLDAIAERYGITIADRHTALGDALVTAAILLHLIEALEAKGITTLDEAMTTLDMTLELHNRGQAFV